MPVLLKNRCHNTAQDFPLWIRHVIAVISSVKRTTRSKLGIANELSAVPLGLIFRVHSITKMQREDMPRKSISGSRENDEWR
jgi:hypothetical protein